MSKPIFPILRKEAPVLRFFQEKVGVTSTTLTPAQKQMAEEFRLGMAEALGVPSEAIREEIVEKWIINWSRAFTKPEYWAQKGYMRRLAKDLVDMVLRRPQPEGETHTQEVREKPRGGTAEEEKRERWNRSEISVEK